MSFTDYCNENQVAPKPKDLCTYIKNKKENDQSYAQYIFPIKRNKSLVVWNGALRKKVEWGTFAKKVSESNRKIPEAV